MHRKVFILANCSLTVDGEVARGLHVQLLDHNLVGALLRRGRVLDDERVGVLLEAPVVLVALEQLQPELAASDVLIEENELIWLMNELIN